MAFDIDQEHPEYVAKKAAWRRYRDLYAGGEQFRVNAAEYLIPRQREPGEVYAERLCRIFYENYVGSIVDWYAATLFRREPAITFDGHDDTSRTFFAAMVEDCDRRGTSLADFFRRQFTESLVTGTSYVLVDFPRVKTRPGTRGEEDASGASRAYLVEYGADDVINWSLDEYGNFEWVVIRTKQIKKDRVEDAEWRTETKWSYYDKQTYRIYGEDGVIDQGNHALAKLGQTPLFALRIPEGLWMLNRAGSLQLEHFNKSNALSWALTMGLFAMPVVYSDREWSQMVGESYYIQLGPQDRFGWTEPEGKVYQIAADNLVRLREEIYRVCYLGLSYTYEVASGDTLDDIVAAITGGMNGPTSPFLTATQTGTTIRVLYPSTAGANGNRFGIYSSTSGSATWDAAAKTLANGASPTKWRVTIDFSSLVDRDGASVPTNKVRKLRWTYAADLQTGAFERSEFDTVISNWSVTGTGRTYSLAGPGSRRYEDDAIGMTYSGPWTVTRGNYSGGAIHSTTAEGDAISFEYTAAQVHTLYLGTRYTGNGAELSIVVDGGAASALNLRLPGEDILIRWPIGEYGTGTHTVTITHAGPPGGDFYFDFLETAVPATTLPTFPDEPRMTLATDWDTDHSIALAPERTAWLIDTLGFKGRQNHYVGALWFYELANPDNVYAAGTVTFGGTPEPGQFVSIFLGRDDDGASATEIQRGMHGGDTLETIAISYANELNHGYTGVWASVSGSVVTIYSRSLGNDGNHYTLDRATTSSTLTASVSSTFSGGHTGVWRTDLTASPRLNRAVRDWNRSFFAALAGYGIDVVTAFSTELRDVDPAVGVGMVQRGPDGDAFLLQTPAYQTNFSPTSLDFWKRVYLDAATIQADAGLQPYLQFGEEQWWYFPNDGLGNAFSGMPFYDAWTAGQFLADYGRAMTVFADNTADPAAYPDEVAFLQTVLGNFTAAIMDYVRGTYSNARFEVLYPLDVNQTPFNRAINYPPSQWTAATLDCLKTEGFGFTLQRNLDKGEQALTLSGFPAFPATQRSHLVGVGDATTAWMKEAHSAQGKGFESVVLFALDQMCLIGYGLPLQEMFRRSTRMGS